MAPNKPWLQVFVVLIAATAVSAKMNRPKSPPSKNSQKASNEWSLRGRLMANPHDKEAHKKLCALLEKRGDFRELVKERRAWLEDNPDEWFELAQLMAEAEVHLNDPEYAIAAARLVLSNVSKEDAETLGWVNNQIGQRLNARRRFAEALPFLESAIKVDPEHSPKYWEDLAQSLIHTGKIAAGVEALRKTIDMDTANPGPHILLGDAFAAKGDLKSQKTEYAVACQLEKTITKPCISLTKLQIGHGEFDDAEKTLDKVLQLDRFELYAYLLRARILEAKDRNDEAKAQRNKAQSLLAEEMQKEKASSMHTAAPLFVFAMDDPQEIGRILEPLKERLTAFDRSALAFAYLELGRSEDAITEFEKSLKSNPKLDTAQHHFTLAEALKKAGLNQKAEDHYRKAYEMDPENVTYRYEYEATRKANASNKQ